jgi:hypothetical protein
LGEQGQKGRAAASGLTGAIEPRVRHRSEFGDSRSGNPRVLPRNPILAQSTPTVDDRTSTRVPARIVEQSRRARRSGYL